MLFYVRITKELNIMSSLALEVSSKKKLEESNLMQTQVKFYDRHNNEILVTGDGSFFDHHISCAQRAVTYQSDDECYTFFMTNMLQYQYPYNLKNKAQELEQVHSILLKISQEKLRGLTGIALKKCLLMGILFTGVVSRVEFNGIDIRTGAPATVTPSITHSYNSAAEAALNLPTQAQIRAAATASGSPASADRVSDGFSTDGMVAARRL